MKTFKSFINEGSIAQDYVAPKDSDDEVKDIKPRSKGEEDFKNTHKMTHTKHPVAGDHQFDGSIKGINEDVELNEKSYKQVFDLKKGSARVRAFLYNDGEYVAYFTGNGETSVGIPGNKLDKKWLKTKLDKFSKSGLIGEEVCACSNEKEAYDKASENDSPNAGALQDKLKACIEREKSQNIGEEVNEDAWSDLQTIVKTLASKNSSGKVKFANGKQETVDMGTAKQIVTVLNKLNPNNKKKAIATLNKDPAGLMKVLDIVHKA